MSATSGLKASDGAEIDYGREWAPYVTVRGGWLFGKAKYNHYVTWRDAVDGNNIKKSIKSAWSGSAEIGSSCDDRVFVGWELGYFTGKMKGLAGTDSVATGGNRFDVTWKVNGKIENYFGACNVTLRHDLNARAFLYGGVGAGVARSRCSYDVNGTMTVTIPPNPAVTENLPEKGGKSKWRFLGQAFAGLGVYLNDNWQLTAGYRLRYVPGSFRWDDEIDDIALKYGISLKQDIVHAAEVGLTYRF